jgi:serine/threonine-protein kinase
LSITVTKPETSDEQDAPPEGVSPRTNPSLPTAERLKQVTLTQAAVGDDVARSRTEPPPAGTVDPYIGATIDGRYFVEAQLGEGGMGVVYRCRHTIIDKKVAMKVLRADMARNEEVTERFLNEARSASSIGNPHIIDISDFGRLPDGATYFIMEFLTGTPLAELAEAREPIDPARAGHIGLQLTEGLSAAHESGIIHRDLKPDNIYLVTQGSQEDFVKILDFGIAKASSSNSKLTQAGQVFGTPHYMSPEQASGSEVDLRSDIYAVGVILYELTTGRLPFDADNFMAILTQHMYKAPVPPSQIEGLQYGLPPGLEDVILRCMAKEPGERFQSMGELGEDLKHVFAGTLPTASSDMRSMTDNYGSPQEYYDRRSGTEAEATSESKSPLMLYASVGLLAAAAAGAAVWFMGQKAEPALNPVVAEAPAEPAATEETDVAPETTQVAIAAAPLSAHVYQGSKDLGESPVMIDVGEDPVDLTVRLDGYIPRQLSIDGSQPKVSIELEKIPVEEPTVKAAAPRPRPAARPSPAPRPKPKPKSLGGGELVNPWD